MSPSSRHPYAALLLVVAGAAVLLIYDDWRDGHTQRLAHEQGLMVAGREAASDSDSSPAPASALTDDGPLDAGGREDRSRLAQATPWGTNGATTPRRLQDHGLSPRSQSLKDWGGSRQAGGFGPAPLSDGGVLREVALWKQVEAESSPMWEVVHAAIALDRDGPYADMGAVPSQPDLVPVGDRPNPATGLWEFVVQGTGRAPPRDAETGDYALTPDSAIVVVLVPGGRFMMGAPGSDDQAEEDEVPRREVLVSPFYIARTETTFFQWQVLRGASIDAREGADDVQLFPATDMAWQDIGDAIRRSSLRLPTETEWEAACRGGRDTRFWSGDDVEAALVVGWYDETAGGERRHVALLAANPFGLHDMHGNVWEWCLDATRPYGDGGLVDPRGPTDSGPTRVVRGGSWDDIVWLARSSSRDALGVDEAYPNVGFRVVRSARD